MVAQLSSRVFLGEQICRNADWLRITIEYSVDSFIANKQLSLWPQFLRPLVAPFMSSCRAVREDLQEARNIIDPVLQARRKEKEEAIRAGLEPERYPDAMEWMEECAKGRAYDPAVAQLLFSLSAIHTTSDMLTQLLFDLCGQPQLVEELRQEVIAVLGEERKFQKSTLYKLKLMDSTLKESQRMKPISLGNLILNSHLGENRVS